VGILAPAGSSTGTPTLPVPATIATGAYFILACADDLAKVVEVDEGNNCAVSSNSILVGWPDLVTTSVSNPPFEISPGKAFAVTDTVVNQGAHTAVASTNRYYLSLNNAKDTGDILLSGTRAVGSLTVGASSTGTVTVTVPATTAIGAYYVLACADDLVKVAEGPTNEGNNCLASSAAVNVRLPDLVQSTLTDPPATAARGGTFTINETVLNQGTIAASATTTRYYLSLNGTTTSAVLLGQIRSVGTLAAGGSSAASKVLTVPSTIASGSYYVLACADDTKVVLESDENNNCRASATLVAIP
jgi:subtilase family serine protease